MRRIKKIMRLKISQNTRVLRHMLFVFVQMLANGIKSVKTTCYQGALVGC